MKGRWSVVDGNLTHAKSGTPLTFEILLVNPSAERYVLPFKKNLERIGVQASVRTVDVAQYRRRMDTYDFDVTVGGFGQSMSPGNEQDEFWGSEAAGREGGRNLIGIQNPAIDTIVKLIISAPDRKTLVTRVHALDRVLQWGHYVVPHFHATSDRLVYWDRFGRPEVTPRRGAAVDTWWIDTSKAARLAPASGGVAQ